MENNMYCKHCGELIDKECVVCPKCGKQVAELKSSTSATPQITIMNNNTNTNTNTNVNHASVGFGRPRNKWVAFCLCFFLGYIGIHKFYEGRVGMGILYIFTAGLFGIGWLVDCISLLCKPNPYYVKY